MTTWLPTMDQMQTSRREWRRGNVKAMFVTVTWNRAERGTQQDEEEAQQQPLTLRNPMGNPVSAVAKPPRGGSVTKNHIRPPARKGALASPGDMTNHLPHHFS